MKKCTQCNLTKVLELFPWKDKKAGKRTAECKECQVKRRRSFYLRHKNQELARNLDRKKQQIEWFQQYKIGLRCVRCGYDKHPAAIDFHHRDPQTKQFNISRMPHEGYSQKRILNEIKKCDIICSNCHRIEHNNIKASSATG